MHRVHTAVLTLAFGTAISGAAYAQTPQTRPQTPQTPQTKPQTPTPQTTPQTSTPHTTSPQTKDSAHAAMAGDADFAKQAAAGGQKEVSDAKFAAGKARNADVKALANKLVTDHTAANRELMSLMKTKRMASGPMPKGEPESWRSAAGAAFDRTWIDHVIEHHEKDIAMFEAEAKNGTDAELKAWAEQKLPTLREHLKMAQDAKSKLSTTTNQ